ncbi:hypothetical protein DFJ74DRAFT_662761 [Hyaloraphidium curvatum]|nr:hypothetical protein DFJ74DRAFT_662761 [Hyaloraphidium curvatum]
MRRGGRRCVGPARACGCVRPLIASRPEVFAQATPDPRSADADLDDVLMMLRAAGPGPRLLGTGWRKVLRLSEAARGKGKGVFGGHGAEIVEGVVREWEDLKEEGGEAAAWPVFALSVLAANQNPLVRSEPGLLGAVLGCFFSAFSADDPGVQASAYSGLLACLRRTDAAALASVCASWLEAPGWDAEPGSDSPAGRACPAWACLKVLALALDRFRTARERDPSAGPAPGLVSRAAMLMARALRSPDPLVRMAGTDVAVAVVALAGEEAIGVLGKGAQGEARKWVVRCAVELWERGEWRLGFAGSGR